MAAIAAVAMVAGTAAIAQAARDLDVGFGDGLYGSSSSSERDLWFDRTVAAKAEIVRINVSWRASVSGEPADARDPNDPAYDFSSLDAAVVDASQRGLDVMLTVLRAPNFAEGPNRPNRAPEGTWKPRPEDFADFGHAVAERYSGALLGLPRVRFYQAWNEENLEVYLSPQYEGKRAASPGIYRRMLNAFYDAVHGVHSDNVVVAGGTAPFGEPPGGTRMRPLVFWRKLLCLSGSLKPVSCPTKAKMDVLAHHPINTSGGPHHSAIHPDDVITPDLHNVVRTLRKAEATDRVLPGGHRPVWVTEFWWESDPPDRIVGIPLARQARWIEEALFLFWKQGARVAINLQIRDSQYTRETALSTLQSGVFRFNGDPKPAYTAIRFPFVTERRSRRKLFAWGKAPSSGSLVIERRHSGDWREVKTLNAQDGELFTTKLSLSGAQRLRARVAGDVSLRWNQAK